ncbi:MAG: GUN4 domain-containing protein [Pseudanabaenaceae cyanobacterium]|jgi:hypothetical protein
MRSCDYSNLEKLLVAREWQEADEVTCLKLVEIVRIELENGRLLDEFLLETLQPKDRFGKFDIRNCGFNRLDQNVLERFPLRELINLDQLWRNHSDDWFGYSQQLEVWKSLGGKETPYQLMENQKEANRIDELFYKEMGWQNIEYRFQDSRSKPKGYLPSYPGCRGAGFSSHYITRGRSWRWQDLVLGRGLNNVS